MPCARTVALLKLRRHPTTAPERQVVQMIEDRKAVSPRLHDQKLPRRPVSIASSRVKNGAPLGPTVLQPMDDGRR